MTNTENESLARAIEELGAVEVAPGRYAWQERSPNDGALSWYVASAESLTSATHRIDGKLMPAWWTPERRFAWRVRTPRGILYGEPIDATCQPLALG